MPESHTTQNETTVPKRPTVEMTKVTLAVLRPKMSAKESRGMQIDVRSITICRSCRGPNNCCQHIKDNIRNKSVMRAKFVQKIFMALFLGSLYFQTQADQDGVTNLKGILFFFCSELTYPTIYGIQTYMPGEFPLVVREYHDGCYPVLAYYIAKLRPSTAISETFFGYLRTKPPHESYKMSEHMVAKGSPSRELRFAKC
ncbi:hypothetical protein NECAME_05556 [Necator americanus]|uniref:ABC-2 type transporter transmembrane domain-containing protein n=1 Tax=Necator americanus TaxID=51031 RepID=W2SIL4_NECAM|nr:hypothetical protein NECAME_05556 [Necator americanus]ETN68592.1 hypothetical protein NECAME_05556 [Necator americanus]